MFCNTIKCSAIENVAIVTWDRLGLGPMGPAKTHTDFRPEHLQ